jgi:hypothetical protein
MQVFFCTVAVLAAFIYSIIWDFMYCSSQAKQLDAMSPTAAMEQCRKSYSDGQTFT